MRATSSTLVDRAGGISRHNRAHLEELHRLDGPFDAAEASEHLGLDVVATRRLLGYLARRGWLARVRRGLYIPVPLEARRSGEWVEDSWIVAMKSFSPCYLGGWTACEHWGLTEQIFRDVVVVTARNVRERNVEMQGINYRLKTRSEGALFGATSVWRGRARVLVSDPSRTIVDILDDPGLGGGIRHIANVIHEYLLSKERNDALLVEYGDRLGNRTVFKRLGYILETAEMDAPELITACAERRSAGLTLLDPTVDTLGRIVKRWNLRVNIDLREAGRGL